MEPTTETVKAVEDIEEKAADNSLEDTIILSQKEYRPTPYVASQWEIVGERPKALEFISLDFEILRDDRVLPDPMFAQFGGPHSEMSAGEVWQSPGSDVQIQDAVDGAVAEVDWAAIETELAAKFDEGRQQGIAEGKAAAEEQIVEKYEIICKRMSDITDAIKLQVEEHIGTLEKRAFELALQVARKVIHTTVELQPDYIVNVLRRAFASLGAAKPVRVRVSHEDYEFLTVVGLPIDLTEGELGVTYVADQAIQSGCVLETDYGELNLELDKLWAEVRQALETGEV